MNKHKIAVYNEKGRIGKTPLALEIALRLGLNYATNQNRPRADIQAIIPEGEFLQVSPSEAFPELEPDFPVVFDLAGELVGYEKSIVSALSQADVIVVPVVNEPDALTGTAYAIAELRTVKGITDNFVIVANMLRHKDDLESITDTMKALLDHNYPIVPVRFSKAFEHMILEGQSIAELQAKGGLAGWSYRNVCRELDTLMKHLK